MNKYSAAAFRIKRRMQPMAPPNTATAKAMVPQMNPEMVASMAESHQAIINGRPIWGTIAFAVAVFGGAIGCILLLMRKAAALYLFIASLLSVMVQLIPNFKLAGKVQFSAGELLMMMVMPLVVAAFLAWYASQTQNKGWIK
jgi:hypothetical protein